MPMFHDHMKPGTQAAVLTLLPTLPYAKKRTIGTRAEEILVWLAGSNLVGWAAVESRQTPLESSHGYI